MAGSISSDTDTASDSDFVVVRSRADLHGDLHCDDADGDGGDGGRAAASKSLAQGPPSPPLPDWNNLKVIHRNTLPSRSHFHLYDTERDALAGRVPGSRAALLSGLWGFHLAPSPLAGPRDFHQPGFDHSRWSLIAVPGMWQCQGFGKGPQYTNVNYPFPVDPPYVPYDDNECGRYVTIFTVPDRIKPAGHQWRLRFEGVDAAFTLWLNGRWVGYSQGSRNPSEFDVTAALEPDGENLLAVEVYQRCDGSYIEDQVSPARRRPVRSAPERSRTNGGSAESSATSGCTPSPGAVSTISTCRQSSTTTTGMHTSPWIWR